MDAFAFKWNEKFGLCVPPVNLISKVLEKMKFDNVKGVMVVPLWQSASFWPLIWNGTSFIDNVIDWIDLPGQKEYYIPCKNNSGIFGKENLKFRMLALKMDFSMR